MRQGLALPHSFVTTDRRAPCDAGCPSIYGLTVRRISSKTEYLRHTGQPESKENEIEAQQTGRIEG